MRAILNGNTIAESDQCEIVESNYYFPPESVRMEFLTKTDKTYTCKWKGVCDYYDVTSNGVTIEEGAFMYPNPNKAAENIRGYFAFWKGIDIVK